MFEKGSWDLFDKDCYFRNNSVTDASVVKPKAEMTLI